MEIRKKKGVRDRGYSKEGKQESSVSKYLKRNLVIFFLFMHCIRMYEGKIWRYMRVVGGGYGEGEKGHYIHKRPVLWRRGKQENEAMGSQEDAKDMGDGSWDTLNMALITFMPCKC